LARFGQPRGSDRNLRSVRLGSQRAKPEQSQLRALVTNWAADPRSQSKHHADALFGDVDQG